MTETQNPNTPSQRQRDQEIDARYGAIGIAAVAAAARYQTIGKDRAPASRKGRDDKGA